MTRHDPWAARDELKRRIAAKVAEASDPDDAVNRVVALFYDVRDDWERIDVTTLGEPGESFVDNRWLVARVPVQGFGWTRPVDRTVEGS